MAVAPESHRLPFSPESLLGTLYAYVVFSVYHSTDGSMRQLTFDVLNDTELRSAFPRPKSFLHFLLKYLQ